MDISATGIGLVTGAVVAWLAARSVFQAKSSGLERRISGLEAQVFEMTKQAEAKERELESLRNRFQQERDQRTEAQTRLDTSQKSLEEQKLLIETMKRELSDTFNALSSAALKSSSEDFLRLASEHLGKIAADTKGRLGEHREALDGTVKPLQEMLRRYEQQITAMEKNRHEAFGSLAQQIKSLSSMQEQLRTETGNLVTALRKPKVSGSWGEMALKNAAELAGMTAWCDFFEQESVSTETGRLRPDMLVRLPNGREIVVDAKAPVDAFMKALEVSGDEERKQAMANYVAQVRNHMTALGSKAYWDQFPRSPELVVMYLPGESFFSTALEHDHRLIEDGSARKVILATPTTFIALLKAVAYGWQQEQMTRSAREISSLGRELYERFAVVVEHFARTGSAINTAVKSYNETARSLETRLIPSIRRFRELGVSSRKELGSLAEVGLSPRAVEHLSPQFEKEEEQ